MSRGLLLAACLACAAAGAAGAARGRTAATTTFSTIGPVEAIAADGKRVAIAVADERGCDSVVVWTAGTTTSQTFVSRNACEGGVVQGIPEVAIAGTRVEWVATTGGNDREMYLEAGRLGTPKVSVVASAVNDSGAAGGVDGSWIGRLAGDGSLLVFDTWKECSVQRAEGASPCPAGGARAGDRIYSQQTLWKLQGTKKVKVLSGPDAFSIVSVSEGHWIALEDPRDGGIHIVDGSGRPLKNTVTVTAGGSSGTVFAEGRVLTLRNGVLQSYNVDSGRLDASVSLPTAGPPPSLLDEDVGLAVYVRGRQVHVVRLSDGKDVTFVAPGKGKVDAQIEPAGLTYAYSVVKGKAHGRVVFVPAADLQAKLG